MNLFLAVTVLLATTGVTLNKHYCMGRLQSITVNAHGSHCCADGEEQMPCCEDVSEEFKIAEITNSSSEIHLLASWTLLPEWAAIEELRSHALKDLMDTPEVYAPPPQKSKKLYKKLEAFLI